MALSDTIQKLKRGLTKSSKRIEAREADERAAAKQAHILTRQIKELRAENGEQAKINRKVTKRQAARIKRTKSRKRAEWWIRRRTVLRKRLKDAKKKWEETHGAPQFETWMLNGCPGNVDEDVKEIIAFQVVVCDQYVTSTTGGTHSPTSWHYSGHAVDTGSTSVSSMQSAAEKTREQFGDSHFLELFSPCPWYIKNGVVYSGYFPAHGDHGHYAVS